MPDLPASRGTWQSNGVVDLLLFSSVVTSRRISLAQAGIETEARQHDDEDGGRKLWMKLLGRKRKGFDATRRRSNGKNISVGHVSPARQSSLPKNDPRYRTVSKSKMPPNLTEDFRLAPSCRRM
jgi:hypothetical protein